MDVVGDEYDVVVDDDELEYEFGYDVDDVDVVDVIDVGYDVVGLGWERGWRIEFYGGDGVDEFGYDVVDVGYDGLVGGVGRWFWWFWGVDVFCWWFWKCWWFW